MTICGIAVRTNKHELVERFLYCSRCSGSPRPAQVKFKTRVYYSIKISPDFVRPFHSVTLKKKNAIALGAIRSILTIFHCFSFPFSRTNKNLGPRQRKGRSLLKINFTLARLISFPPTPAKWKYFFFLLNKGAEARIKQRFKCQLKLWQSRLTWHKLNIPYKISFLYK